MRDPVQWGQEAEDHVMIGRNPEGYNIVLRGRFLPDWEPRRVRATEMLVSRCVGRREISRGVLAPVKVMGPDQAIWALRITARHRYSDRCWGWGEPLSMSLGRRCDRPGRR